MAEAAPLVILPAPLGETAPLEVLPLSIRHWIEKIDYYIVENEKVARRTIKKIAPKKKQEELQFYILDKYSQEIEIQPYLEPCLSGIPMGVLSDAGCPGIADPGALIVARAHRLNIPVKPLVGPSSILLGLMASGLNGQQFTFNGYLPIDASQKKKRLQQLEQRAKQFNEAQLFIETPYRNQKLFTFLCKVLSPHTQVTIACHITTPEEWIKTKTIKEWKSTAAPNLHKRPTLFILQ